jgi:thiamine pyrophosphokinase
MQWLVALVKAILEWATAEIKKDTKAGDADSTPQSLKDRWRRKIEEQEKKVKKDEPPKDSDSGS